MFAHSEILAMRVVINYVCSLVNICCKITINITLIDNTCISNGDIEDTHQAIK